MAALFHIGKLVAEGGDGCGGQGFGEICHKGVIHSGAGSVAEDEEVLWLRRREEDGGHFPAWSGLEAEVSYFGHLTDFSRNLRGWTWVRGVLRRFTRANVLGFEEGSRDKAASRKERIASVQAYPSTITRMTSGYSFLSTRNRTAYDLT